RLERLAYGQELAEGGGHAQVVLGEDLLVVEHAFLVRTRDKAVRLSLVGLRLLRGGLVVAEEALAGQRRERPLRHPELDRGGVLARQVRRQRQERHVGRDDVGGARVDRLLQERLVRAIHIGRGLQLDLDVRVLLLELRVDLVDRLDGGRVHPRDDLERARPAAASAGAAGAAARAGGRDDRHGDGQRANQEGPGSSARRKLLYSHQLLLASRMDGARFTLPQTSGTCPAATSFSAAPAQAAWTRAAPVIVDVGAIASASPGRSSDASPSRPALSRT